MRLVLGGEPDFGFFLRRQGAALSAGAAAIHFAQISSHVEEYWVFGVFFLAAAWFQAASAVALVASSYPRLLVAIIAVNLAVIGIWVWSRTAGLPIGPEAGEPEAIGAADLLATVLEALLVAWASAARVPSISSRAASTRVGVLTTAIIWTGVVAMTAVVFLGAGPEAGH